MESADLPTLESPLLLTPKERVWLPPELIDAILELLRDDQTTLKTCALVCRSWVPLSRYHLLLQVVLDRKTVTKASEILLATTCTIAPSIQHVILDQVEEWREAREEDLNLCRLKQITFRRMSATMQWCDSPCGLNHLLHNLESLCLQYITFTSHSLLLVLLHHVPQLQSLSCKMVHFIDDTGHGLLRSSSDELVPKLKSLQLYRYRGVRLLHLLMERWASAFPPLTTLDLDFWSYQFGDFEAHMSVLGSNLQVLRLTAWPEHLHEVGIAQRFHFFTRLHSLFVDFTSQMNGSLEWVISALSNLTSPHFQELIIVLESESCGAFDLDTWSALASLLESPRFSPTLRTLAFRFEEYRFKLKHQAVRTRKRWIEKRFPTFVMRGILQVEHLG